ncbi:hypothetical protein EDM52_01545 [Brevibacillus invocatus]|uniref:Uncharacterized protein n=1 Tax=Brevibacillus invocatus TaxID=173959 RepID=A0A3M8CMP0_9BACL|nr:hypothetical protein EDM52_01545 [Brevibacillus invocatus]
MRNKQGVKCQGAIPRGPPRPLGPGEVGALNGGGPGGGGKPPGNPGDPGGNPGEPGGNPGEPGDPGGNMYDMTFHLLQFSL